MYVNGHLLYVVLFVASVLPKSMLKQEMNLKIYFIGVLLISFINNADFMMSHASMGHMGQSTAPIEVKSVHVTSSFLSCTNVTVTFVAMENVTVLWTVNEGFLPEDLNARATSSLYRTGNSNSASICLPTDMPFDSLRLHLICQMHSFELHLSLQVSHNMSNTLENVKQYDLLVPQSNEIGISSRGEARFHVMVDTTGTKFTFGMLQAEAMLLNGAVPQHDTAFSFLPDNNNKKKMLRMRKVASSETEYHADIAINSRDLQSSKTMISVSVACTQPASILHRLDMKQVTYLQRNTAGLSPSQMNPVAILGEQKQESFSPARQSNVLLRCKAFGFPRPNVTLLKKEGTNIRPQVVPSYTTSLEFERTTVYQLLNVTVQDSGLYICKTSNTISSAEKTYTVQVQ